MEAKPIINTSFKEGAVCYTGGCHCGAVKFEAQIDFSKQSTGRCNCTICVKGRAWGASITPNDFKLVSPSDYKDLGDYQMSEGGSIHHYFCKQCGIRSFVVGAYPMEGGIIYHFVSVAVSCLDNLTPEQLSTLPIKYSNGLDNNWWSPPTITSYL
eukprot:gene20246-24275_t